MTLLMGATSNAVKELLRVEQEQAELPVPLNAREFGKTMVSLEKEMFQFAENLEFEQAARVRDRIEEIRAAYLKS